MSLCPEPEDHEAVQEQASEIAHLKAAMNRYSEAFQKMMDWLEDNHDACLDKLDELWKEAGG